MFEDIIGFGNSDPVLFIDILIRKFYIIYADSKLKAKKIKYNPLFEKLYTPLFDNLKVEFHCKLIDIVLNLIDGCEISEVSRKLYKKIGLRVTLTQSETDQLLEWTPYFKKFIFKTPFSMIPKTLCKTPTELLDAMINKIRLIYRSDKAMERLLKQILEVATEENYGKEMLNQLSELVRTSEVSATNKKILEFPPSIDDILAEKSATKRSADDDVDDENENKRRKNELGGKKVYLLEQHDDWRPTPFGMSV
ncbi:LAS1 [Candida pseudojiufengensis]|uniref:LAS1 n=1 Tax=Candida pseudojiufengensis TaxID=497109 RepID=UPI0022250844|nr:LAS1 [Candida pseudojiufengensis]KAI5964671.1 LAS1 [Candida pseudojiufengensis]